jgi:hypothetical protein
MIRFSVVSGLLACVMFVARAEASQESIGPKGINSAGLLGFDGQPLTGAGVAIGQVELVRPGNRLRIWACALATSS